MEDTHKNTRRFQCEGGVVKYFNRKANADEIVPMLMFYSSFYVYMDESVDGRVCV